MITSTGGFSNYQQYGPLIKKFYLAGLGESIPDDHKFFFSEVPSKREFEDLLSVGDMAPIQAFSGQLNYDEIRENYRKRVTNIEYAGGLAIQRKLWETDSERKIAMLAQHLGEKVKLRRLVDCYSLLNNAFNTTNTGGDGLALCSTAHTSNVGGADQGNAGTTALSPAAVDATYVLGCRFNTNRDNPMFGGKFDTIIVPTELGAYANEIAKTQGKVDSQSNNINAWYGRYKVLESRMLTDTNNWFMANTQQMKKNQIWFNVVKHDFGQDTDFSSLVKRWFAYMFYGYGFERWEHIYGHNVS